jgi:N-dimethylarginine dimethylaminohydrolase
MTRLPSDLDEPSFLMAFPFTVGAKIPNNEWMLDEAAAYDLPVAFQQWINLYHRLAREAIVWLLPAEGDYQDRPFVADIAALLPHKPNVALIANLTAEGRRGEERVARRFFEDMGYQSYQSLYPWEGSADLKHLRDNLYVGGYGQRSSREAFTWIAEAFGAEITTVHLADPKAYHFDASLFVLSEETVVMATILFDKADVAKVEKVAEIIAVPPEHAYAGWTNSIRIGRSILHNGQSRASFDAFAELLDPRGFELEWRNCSQFEKSGADLSCLALSLGGR